MLAGTLALALVTGGLPGWLSPGASWRRPYPTAPLSPDFSAGAQNEPDRCHLGPGRCLENCYSVHRHDVRLGYPACSRLFPGALEGCGGESPGGRPGHDAANKKPGTKN